MTPMLSVSTIRRQDHISASVTMDSVEMDSPVQILVNVCMRQYSAPLCVNGYNETCPRQNGEHRWLALGDCNKGMYIKVNSYYSARHA